MSAPPQEAATRAAELRRQLDHHSYRYHVLDDPEVGDDVYDAMLDEAAVSTLARRLAEPVAVRRPPVCKVSIPA